ncbi:hypothetical protein [Flexivirga sp.]|uniref:hypothetical protein n=1 Tax=Flexivirga sp. TaxID=1962927 RepID=UPI003F81F426
MTWLPAGAVRAWATGTGSGSGALILTRPRAGMVQEAATDGLGVGCLATSDLAELWRNG